ncbi:hypothetical protein ACQKIE_00960 [Luteibacter sp. NPDC031894]|uniref:hypothetical protein n=1 Tax=Luteibacter sp. NPDC031894 TaxID=3390572 RepID=UPI003CFD161C
MSAHTLRRRAAMRYASIKHADDREVRAEHRIRVATHRASRSLSRLFRLTRLQHWFERSGWFMVLLVGMGFFGLAACGRFEPRPDLKVSTLT